MDKSRNIHIALRIARESATVAAKQVDSCARSWLRAPVGGVPAHGSERRADCCCSLIYIRLIWLVLRSRCLVFLEGGQLSGKLQLKNKLNLSRRLVRQGTRERLALLKVIQGLHGGPTERV